MKKISHIKLELLKEEFSKQIKDRYILNLSMVLLEEFENLKTENQELKKQLEEKNKPQIFIDTQDIEERYAEGLYQDYLEEENKKYKNQQKEFIEWLTNEANINPYDISDYIYEDIINTILSKYKESGE